MKEPVLVENDLYGFLRYRELGKIFPYIKNRFLVQIGAGSLAGCYRLFLTLFSYHNRFGESQSILN